jgi:hypothetical protein
MTSPRQTSKPPTTAHTEQGNWRYRLQAIASTSVVIAAVAAGSVVAASEALQEAPGDAIGVFCSALGVALGLGHGPEKGQR